MWVKFKKSFKVYMSIFVTLLSIFTFSSMGYASGVPLYNSDYTAMFSGYSISTGFGQTSAIQTAGTMTAPSGLLFGGTGSFTYNGYGASVAYVSIYGSNDNVNWTLVASSGWLPGTYTYSMGTYVFTYLRANICWTNSGSYSQYYTFENQVYGVAADQNTAQSALNAANAANAAAQATQSYAQNASTQASNASSYASQALNWLNGTWGGYNLGTIGQAATAASNWLSGSWGGYSLGTIGQNATNAMNNAASANTNAVNALNATNTANNYLTNGTYGLSAINTNVNNTTTAVNTLQSAIPYLQSPLLMKVYGYNNATATSTTSFNVAMTYSGANEYQYKVDNGGWSGWNSLNSYNSNGYFTASVPSSSGQHTIYVQLRNNNGAGVVSPVASGQMTMFKL